MSSLSRRFSLQSSGLGGFWKGGTKHIAWEDLAAVSGAPPPFSHAQGSGNFSISVLVWQNLRYVIIIKSGYSLMWALYQWYRQTFWWRNISPNFLHVNSNVAASKQSKHCRVLWTHSNYLIFLEHSVSLSIGSVIIRPSKYFLVYHPLPLQFWSPAKPLFIFLCMREVLEYRYYERSVCSNQEWKTFFTKPKD